MPRKIVSLEKDL